MGTILRICNAEYTVDDPSSCGRDRVLLRERWFTDPARQQASVTAFAFRLPFLSKAVIDRYEQAQSLLTLTLLYQRQQTSAKQS